MNILVISISAPPKNSPESVQVGRYLQQLSKNNKVALLTTKVVGGWEPADTSLLKYIKDVVRVIRLNELHPKLVTITKRLAPSLLVPDHASFFSFQFKKALSQVKEKPEIIFSRSAPFSSAMMALKFSKHWNIPWVMHLSDPWSDNPFLTLSARDKIRNEQMEQECVHRANLVTLTSHKTVAFYKKKYPVLANKFKFLPNVFDEEFVSNTPVPDTGKVKFVFTGRLYGNRTIHPLLDAAEKILESNPVLADKCEFILAGFFTEESIARIKSSKLNNIKYLGHLSMQEALKVQREASVLIVIDAVSKNEIFDLFFPSKLLDYFAAKKPILAFTGKNSTTYEIVEGKFGKCFHPENISELDEYLISLIERGNTIEDTVYTADIAEYSASKNAFRLQEMFNEVLRHG